MLNHIVFKQQVFEYSFGPHGIHQVGIKVELSMKSAVHWCCQHIFPTDGKALYGTMNNNKSQNCPENKRAGLEHPLLKELSVHMGHPNVD